MERKNREHQREIQLVVFVLENEEFACHIGDVREVLKMVKVTPLPRSLEFIEGVINLRGEVIPVLDLRKRFGLKETERNEKNRIIIAEVSSNLVGLIVDAVTEVVRLPEAGIQAAPGGVAGDYSQLISGVGNIHERLLIILNLEHILSSEEQYMLEKITEAGRKVVEGMAG